MFAGAKRGIVIAGKAGTTGKRGIRRVEIDKVTITRLCHQRGKIRSSNSYSLECQTARSKSNVIANSGLIQFSVRDIKFSRTIETIEPIETQPIEIDEPSGSFNRLSWLTRPDVVVLLLRCVGSEFCKYLDKTLNIVPHNLITVDKVIVHVAEKCTHYRPVAHSAGVRDAEKEGGSA
jgi:hypothetical protein